jgi:AMMECR1 domain-containing protein
MSTPGFPLTPLARPLGADERNALRASLQGLLHWQRELRKWPAFPVAPDATPIISLYSKSGLCGCAGVSDGPPAERVFRAFVQALGDGRFGGLGPEARAELRCQLSYALNVTPLALAEARATLEVSRHGLAVASSGRPITLLPDVAGDNGLDAEGMLETLERKAGTPRSEWPDGGLYVFETETVVARQSPTPELAADPVEAAAEWLARRVDADGEVTFGVNPRTGESHQLSPMFHGRVAILVRALCAQKNGRGAALRARRFLSGELTRALGGQRVEQFPEEPALIAGTLALASLCGIELSDALHAYAARAETRAVPWHAAQVVAALGKHAPTELWQACQRQLESEPWAPWTAIAAKARGDGPTLERAAAALIAAVPEHEPHIGGVGPGSVPELARTAATVEALAPLDSPEARAACQRARRFLLAHQLHGERCAKAADPLLVHGAFPQTPVHDFLQIDVTGHALLALSA